MRDDPVAATRDLTDGNRANIVFECAGGSPKGGLARVRTLQQAVDSVRSGVKIVGVSWFGTPLEFDTDLLRERSLRATRTRLGRIGAGPMSDALGKTGAMSHEVRPRSRDSRMAGPAFTVRIHTADILMVG